MMAEQFPRRYQASERKLQYLRQAGAGPWTRVVSGGCAVSVGVGVLILGRHLLTEPLTAYMQASLQLSGHGYLAPAQHLTDALAVVAVALAPVGLAGLGGWLLGNLLQSGFALRRPWAKPGDTTLYYMPRQRPDTLVRGLLAALLLAAAGTSFVAVLQTAATLPVDGQLSIGCICRLYLQAAVAIFVPALAAVILLDWLWSRHSYLAEAGMTEAERRRELRETEISWLSRWRRKMRQRGGRR